MIRFHTLLALTVVGTVLMGCQQKKVEKQKLQFKRVLETPEFSKIEAEGNLNLRIKQGDKNEVHLVTENEGKIPYFSWTVKNNTLSLEHDPPFFVFPGSSKKSENFIVFITVKKLEAIELEDQALAMVFNMLNGDSLKVELSDLSKLWLKGSYNHLILSMEDVTSFNLEGSIKNVKAVLEDDATWEATKAPIEYLNLTISEIAKAEVVVTEKLSVSATDLSRVVFAGDPKTQDFNSADGAKIIKK